MQVVTSFNNTSESSNKWLLLNLIGQSNMVGEITETPDSEYQGNISDRAFIYDPNCDENVLLNYPSTNNPLTGDGMHGPELSLAKYLTENLPSYSILIVKVAWGDTGMYKAEDGVLDWNVSSRYKLHNINVTHIKRAYELLNIVPDAIYTIDCQGEKDISSSSEYPNFYNYKGSMLTRIKQDTGLSKIKTIFEVFEETARTPYSAVPWASVRSDQLKLISDDVKNRLGYALDGKTLESDGIHFTSASQIEIGNELGQMIIDDL